MRIWLIACMGWILGAASAVAQTPSKPATTYPLPVPHVTIVVVAEDMPDDVRTSGRDVIVVDVRQAQQAGIHTVADVLRYVAELNVVSTGVLPGALTSLFVRGANSNHVLVLVDNVPVNQIGGFYDFAHLPLENVARVEILKGPGSTVYGSEAAAAVVRIVTRKRTDTPLDVRVTALGGSFATWHGVVEAAGGFANGMFYSMSVGRLVSDRQLPINDAYRRWTASVQIGGDHANGHHWAVRYRMGDYDVHFPTSGAGDRFDVLDPNQFQRIREHILSAAWTAAWSPHWETRLDVGFYRNSSHYEDPADGPEVDPFGPFWSDQIGTRLRMNASTTVRWAGHRLTVGATWTREWGKDRNLFAPMFVSHSRISTALYIREDYESADKRWGATAGVRYERHSDYADIVAPELSVSYWLTPGMKWHAAVGIGYRAPAFFQVYGLGGFITGNPNLKPERNIGWDVGLEYWGKFSWPVFRLTYFDNRLQDLIQFINRPDPTVPDYANVQAARARGIEVGMEYRWHGWVSRLSYTLTLTEVTDTGDAVPTPEIAVGQPLLRRPKHRATWTIGYQGTRWSVWADVLYQGRRWDLDFSRFPARRVAMDAYVRMDVRARWQFTDRWAVFARVDNVWNTRYEEVFGYTGLKRGIYLGMQVAP